MKTFIFSALALGMLASCANTDVEGVSTVDNGEPVAIQLSAGVQQNVVVSRAPITGGATFKAKILGWEDGKLYTDEPSWTTTADNINATGETNELVLATQQYYLTNGKSTKMKAFYPSDVVINAINKNIYNFTNTDGQMDVLMASEVVGNKDTKAPVQFKFTHPLTQLIFKLEAGAGFPSDVTIRAITVNEMKLPVGIDVVKDSVVYSDTSADISVPEIAANTVIGNSEEPVGKPLMVAPIAGGEFMINVTASGNRFYENIPVKLDGITTEVTGAGVAYIVTLTFKEKISATSLVTDWTSGTGSAVVE